ncbi:MAG: hypothetical protein GXC73_16015 [Chitinophagaceae bacterium]|nr:hypothetical protein [Chitinophagaceae bacterium]
MENSESEEWFEANKLEIRKFASHIKKGEKEIEELFSKDHDFIGRLLKAHLILENIIDRYLEVELHIPSQNQINLRFFQKLLLVECNEPKLKFQITCVKEVNSARNKIAHNLNTTLNKENIPNIVGLISWVADSNKLQNFTPIDYIEEYTYFFCHILYRRLYPDWKTMPFELKRLFEGG